jgi:hypothetical protein
MPDDLDQELEPGAQGTARLVQAALNAPPPAEEAEAESRRQVEQLMQDAALSPKVLREAVREQPRRPWWQKILDKKP